MLAISILNNMLKDGKKLSMKYMGKKGKFLYKFFMQEEPLMKKLTEVYKFGVPLLLVVDRTSEFSKELHTQFQNK